MPRPLTPGEARDKHAKAFQQFWKYYPQRINPRAAHNAFAQMCERGVDPERLIRAARDFALRTGEDLTYVPQAHKWLEAGRWEDADLMTDQRNAGLAWLEKCRMDCDIRAVEQRFSIKYEKPPLPDDIESVEAAKHWSKEQKRAWIAAQRHRFEGER